VATIPQALSTRDAGILAVDGVTALNGHREDILRAAHEFAAKGLDAALLTTGGKAAEQAIAALREGGRAAYPNGVENAPQAGDGVKVTSYNGEPDLQTFAKLNELIEGGPFEVHIARTFKLEDAAEAQKALNDHYLGKLALVLS
jgi:NADPH2:quinone reductase